MNVRAELALTAARVRIRTEALPEHLLPDVAEQWRGLLDELDNHPTDRAKVAAIIDWRERFELRMSSVLLNAPLQAAPRSTVGRP